MPIRVATRTIGVIAGVALAATACGGGSDATEAGADRPQSFDDIEYESPIADFLGQDTSMDFSSDEAQAEFAAQQAEAEERIAQCMANEGFEYVPMDHGSFVAFGVENEELPYFSAAWVAKYGFGISTQRFPQSEVGPDLVGYDDSDFPTADEEFVDPNQDYIDSLSPAEQDAYFKALYGDEPDLPDDATDEDYEEAYENWIPDGCQYEGQEELFGGGQDFYTAFGDELQELYERVEADQRVIDWRAEVASCVSDKGFEYLSMQELYEYFENKIGSIGGGFMGDPFEGTNLDPEQMTEDELDDFFRDLNALTDEDREVLAEVQKEEIDLATVTVECGGGPLQEAVFSNDIRVEYEQQFLADNADRLVEFEGSASDS